MRVLIIDSWQGILKEVQTLPPMESRVDLGYKPYPKVKEILMYPSEVTLKECSIDSLLPVEAIIYVH